MKFSVLLPTRNRLKYLSYALASILRQDYDEWEIIVSDNFSDEPILQYIAQLKDNRIKYFRTDKFVSVTENWNNTLNHCSGDYVIMLGDDDILLKNYFSKMFELLNRFENPDLIYTNAYIYTYPGVDLKFPNGMFHSDGNSLIFENSKGKPFYLSRTAAMKLVQGYLDFKAYYGTNMQHALISQSMINKIKVDNLFFHTLYPDYYAMNVLLLEAEKILVYPKEAVVIGVTPKSIGNYLVNNEEKKAMEFLKVTDEFEVKFPFSNKILPGSFSLTAWLIAMNAVRLFFEKKYDLYLNFNRYQLLQIKNLLIGFFFLKQTPYQKKDVFIAFKKTPFKMKVFYFIPLLSLLFLKRITPKFIKQKMRKIRSALLNLISSHKDIDISISETFSNIFEIFERHENGNLYTQREINEILKASKLGIPIGNLCLVYGISESTFLTWKSLYESEFRS